MTLPESPEELLGQPTDMSMGQSTAPPTTASGGMAYASDGYLAPSSGGGYSSGGVTYSPLLGAHLRARYNTRSYGQTRGNLDLGAMKLYDQGDSAWFLDGQVVINDENQFGYNAGIGYRFLTLPLLPFTADDQKLAGISVWSDGMFTVNDNFISQIGISAEYLGEYWDLRSNVYIPFADIEVGDFESNGEITYFGNFLAEQTVAPTDEALTVTDIEVARRLGEIEAWGFLGGYGMYGDETDTAGYKVGLRGYATPDILLQFAVVDDDVFGTNAVFSGTWFIGRTRANTPQRTPIAMRMREPVIRNNYIAVRQGTRTSGDALVGDVDGNGTDEEIRVVHFDPNAPDGGDGSFERPFNNLSDAQQTGFETSIALVRSGTFTDDVLNADFARILGEGNDIEHTIVTTTRGTVTLPETSAGARSLSAPNINLTGFTDDAITLAKLTSEVSNFEITGGNRAIVSPAGVAAVDINNVSVDGTFGNAIELTAASVQSDPNDTSVLQSQFSPTLSDLTFTNVGGDDINLDATLAVTGGPTQVENIGITNVTSTDGTGVGIRITENVNAVTINDFTHSGGLGVTGGALQVNDGTGALAVTDATISNQVGFGIQLNNSDAGHTFNDVTITDTGAAAFEVVGGPTNAATTTTFTGQINQGGTGAAVSISGEHGGTITFAESTTDAGVVNATNGTGIQLNDADGSYAFNSAVVLNGGDAGIDMLNDTDGDLTITDGTIVSPTGAAVNVEDGNATLFYTGSITQANNAAAVNVSGGVNGHEGTLIFDEGTTDAGVITATNGSGLRFENANGGYIFNDAVVLNGTTNGANTGIGLTSGSDGNFQFADATIVDPTGDAISIDGGDSTQVFNYTGTITQSNNAAALSVTGGHEGQVTISPETAGDPSITATNGTGLVFNQANGAYTIDGEVTLNGTTNNAATGISITNSGVDAADPADDLLATFNFNDVTITDPNGVGLAISGGNNNVNYTGSVTQNTNAFAAVSVAGGHVGTLTMNGATSTSNVVTASQGAGITFNNADGTYAINGVVELDSSVTGGATGISIVNSGESGEAASFTFTDATITDPNAVGLAINGGVADVNFTGQINQGANNFAAVEVTGGHEGTVNLSEGTADAGVVVATAGAGVNLNDADGNYFFNDGVNLTGGPRIQVNNGSSGLASFDADSTITNATGDALVVENSDATVIYDGEITDNAGNAVLIQGNTGGSVAVSGMVTSTGSGVVIQANTDGNYSLTGGLELTTGANNAVTVTGNDATVTITGAEITTTTGDGFSVTANTGGTTTINTATVDTGDGDAIQFTGNNDASLVVNSLNATITGAGDAINASGNTDGAVTVNNATTDTVNGDALEFDNNTDTDLTVATLIATATGTGDGVSINANTGSTPSLSGLDITTTSGAGFTADGTDGIAVIGGGNNVTTTTGVGLSLNNLEVGSGGINFASVSVDGAANGVSLTNLTGNAVTVGATGTSAGDGGTLLNTTGDAIVITNAANVSLNFMQATGSGASINHTGAAASSVTIANSSFTGGANEGIDADTTGSGAFALVLDTNQVSGTTQEGININLGPTANTARVTLNGNIVSNTSGVSAAVITSTSGQTNLLLDGNSFTNTSGGNAATSITANGTATLNATVNGNTFANGAPNSQPLAITNDSATASTRLSLTNNTASATAEEFFLINNAGAFTVRDLTDLNDPGADTNNGDTSFTPNIGAFGNEPNPVPTP